MKTISKESQDDLLKKADDLKQAVVVSPQDSMAWNNLGVVLGELGRHDEAVEAYRHAIEIDPQYSMAWSNLGFVFGELGRYDEAVDALRRAIEIDPQNSMAWNNLGFALGELGRHEEAVDALERAVEIDPQHSMAWENLERALRRIQAIKVTRDCAAVNGKFEYKVVVKNYTTLLITNVTITVLAYPDDCMEISGPPVKSIERIGAGERGSSQFIFVPTKDNVEGRIDATVSYVDNRDQAHMFKVDPVII